MRNDGERQDLTRISTAIRRCSRIYSAGSDASDGPLRSLVFLFKDLGTHGLSDVVQCHPWLVARPSCRAATRRFRVIGGILSPSSEGAQPTRGWQSGSYDGRGSDTSGSGGSAASIPNRPTVVAQRAGFLSWTASGSRCLPGQLTRKEKIRTGSSDGSMPMEQIREHRRRRC